MGKGLVGDPLKALHILEAGEDDLEALVRVMHQLTQSDDYTETFPGVGIEQLVGLVQHDQHPSRWLGLHGFTNMPGDLLRPVRGDASVQQFSTLEAIT
jgi:hypothetical protein